MLRKLDFEKIDSSKENKSLQKNWDFFQRDKSGTQYRGRESFGPFGKKTKKKNIRKKYYLAPHAFDEYFAMEILQFLGINTPKTRFVLRKKNHKSCTHIATQSIPNYIPKDGVVLENMTPHQAEKEKAYDQDPSQETIPALLEMRERYRLDIRRQIFRDLLLKKEYKISGNFFAFDLMLTLVADPDAMAYTNFGFHIQGERCFAVAIDKDQADFGSTTYKNLRQKVDPRIYEDEDRKKHIAHHLFHYREREQLLDVLYRLNQGLIPDERTGLSPIDQIFLNSRVQNTQVLFHYPYSEYCKNFKKSAQSTLDFYAKQLEPTYLEAYTHREKMRAFIADIVLESLDVSNVDQNWIRGIIIEDLRGPYYKSFFHGKFPASQQLISGTQWETSEARPCIHVKDITNDWLIRHIIASVKKEFGLQSKVNSLASQFRAECRRVLRQGGR